MGKIAVKLAHADNAFKKDSGERFEPYVTHQVEDTPRMQDAIRIGLLLRLRDEDEAPVKELAKEQPKIEEPAKDLVKDIPVKPEKQEKK